MQRWERWAAVGAASAAVLLAAGALAVWLDVGSPSPPVQAVTLPQATATAAAPTPTPRPPIELSGAGNSITETFLLQPGAVRATMVHEGKAIFTVRLEDAQGNPAGGVGGLGSELANAVGPFRGEKTTHLNSLGTYRLSVTADGPWRVTLRQ